MLSISACSPKGKPGGKAWYSKWISEKNGEVFYSEISLKKGEVVVVTLPSEQAIEVGYYVEKSYEISSAPGTIYMGTKERPHMTGASPGSWKRFDPVKGSIEVRFENTSSIPTRLAVYTMELDGAAKSELIE